MKEGRKAADSEAFNVTGKMPANLQTCYKNWLLCLEPQSALDECGLQSCFMAYRFLKNPYDYQMEGRPKKKKEKPIGFKERRKGTE